MNDPFDALPPWDAARWFQNVKRTTFTTGASPIRVAAADPNRVAILFATTGSQVDIDTQTHTTGVTAQVSGIGVTTANSPLVLRFSEVGPMVNGEFWAYTGGGTTYFTVWEVSLKEWPRPKRGRVRGEQAGSLTEPS